MRAALFYAPQSLFNAQVATAIGATQLATYADLRAFTGTPKAIQILDAATSGIFILDTADTTTVDNGGTVIVASNGARWKRLYQDGVHVTWFNGIGAKIQAAVNVAYATGGYVVIPANYDATESYSNENNIPILDMRHGGIGVWTKIAPSYPVDGYPQGNDMVDQTAGPADRYIENLKTAATTAANLVVGSNTVLISSVVTGNIRQPTARSGGASQFSLNAGLLIGRDTANEEYVDIGNWSIVDETHITLTCTKTHAGPVDIEQVGSFLVGMRDLYICAHFNKAAQSGFNPSWVWKDLHGNPILYYPSDSQTSEPYSLFRIGIPMSGENGANKDFVYKHQLSTSKFIIKGSGNQTYVTVDGTGNIIASSGIEVDGEANKAGSTGAIQFGKTSAAITSTTDVFVTWQGNNDPLNPSNTAGSLLLASRAINNTQINFASNGVWIGSWGASGLKIDKGFSCNGKTPQAAFNVNAAATDAATTQALVNQLRAALIANGICV